MISRNRFRNSRANYARQACAGRLLRVEQLEPRHLLSITVTTTVDENDGPAIGTGTSLREALSIAAAGDTIDFAVLGTINLSNLGALAINKDITISGPGASQLSLVAYDPTPTQKNGDGSRIFTIDDGNAAVLRSVAISGLTLRDGDTSNGGGAILAVEDLEITNCILTNNTSTSTGIVGGGAIYSANTPSLANTLKIRGSTLTGNTSTASEGGAIRKRYGYLLVENCTLDSNRASTAGAAISVADSGAMARIASTTISNNVLTGATYGGAVLAVNATLTVEDSIVSGNSGAALGGGLHVRGGSLTLTRTRVANNVASRGSGGGLYLANSITTAVECTIAGNSASSSGGGIYATAGGSLSLSYSTVDSNKANGANGGGIINYFTSLTIMNCAITRNSAFNGGGIQTYFSSATVTVLGSTISSNTAITDGGGVFNDSGRYTISRSTLSNNAAGHLGGGIFAVGTASNTVSIASTIVSGNINADVEAFFSATAFASQGYNLIGTGSASTRFNAVGDQVGVTDPLLAPLAKYGGTTESHLPRPGSPAVDQGDPNAVAGAGGVPEFDQRGAGYGRVTNGDLVTGERIDVGAIELPVIPPAYFGDYDHSGVTDAADYVIWRGTRGPTRLEIYSGADGNGNSIVDLPDYTVWRAHFGAAVPVAQGAAVRQAVVMLTGFTPVAGHSQDPYSTSPYLIGIWSTTTQHVDAAAVAAGGQVIDASPTNLSRLLLLDFRPSSSRTADLHSDRCAVLARQTAFEALAEANFESKWSARLTRLTNAEEGVRSEVK